MDACLTSDEIKIQFPETTAKLDEAAKGFEDRSTFCVFVKCVGALDGLLVKIFQPTNVSNPRDYFSGHYQTMGVNVQGMCDSKCRFIYVAIGGPGKLCQRLFHHNFYKLLTNSLLLNFYCPATGCTSDLRAYKGIALPALVENLPVGFHIVADAAYMVTEHLLGPYHGVQRDNEANQVFNFYLSQLRIRIEMAFGLLTTKWRILRDPILVDVKDGSLAKIVETCAILHNFVITHDGTYDNDDIETYEDTLLTQQTADETNDDEIIMCEQGVSILRNFMRDEITENGYVRPQHNVERNA